MNDDEVIKEATEAYNQNLGAGCYVGDLLGIISRQNAEIERLQKDLDIIIAANTELYGAFEENERLKSEIERLEKHTELYHELKSEAIKEFAEILKEKTGKAVELIHICVDLKYLSLSEIIDNLVKEMVGERNGDM